MAHQNSLIVLSEVFPPGHGGSGRWLWELYRRLPEFDVTVVAGRVPGDSEFDEASPFRTERFSRPVASWGVLNFRSLAWYARAVRQVRRLVEAHPPAAIHCGKCLPEGLVALRARSGPGTPLLCFAHGEELTLAETSRELRWLTRHVLDRASRIVANSRHTESLLTGRWGVHPEKVAVLTPGVDTERFRPVPEDRAVRHRLGWEGRRVILTVGALQKRKGQDMLIRALPEIRRQCPDVLYAIAGEGWERSYLEWLVESERVSESVTFLGTPDEAELVHLYQQCDLFALPNRQVGWDFEGFGMVLLEAQACGKAVVTGQSGGTVETIIPGETGLAVPCDTPEPLARACLSLLVSPERRATMGARARTWVEGRFDWSTLARQASDLLAGQTAPV